PFLLNRSRLPICSYNLFLFWPVTLKSVKKKSINACILINKISLKKKKKSIYEVKLRKKISKKKKKKSIYACIYAFVYLFKYIIKEGKLTGGPRGLQTGHRSGGGGRCYARI